MVGDRSFSGNKQDNNQAATNDLFSTPDLENISTFVQRAAG
jgi:hypothetical protein